MKNGIYYSYKFLISVKLSNCHIYSSAAALTYVFSVVAELLVLKNNDNNNNCALVLRSCHCWSEEQWYTTELTVFLLLRCVMCAKITIAFE